MDVQASRFYLLKDRRIATQEREEASFLDGEGEDEGPPALGEIALAEDAADDDAELAKVVAEVTVLVEQPPLQPRPQREQTPGSSMMPAEGRAAGRVPRRLGARLGEQGAGLHRRAGARPLVRRRVTRALTQNQPEVRGGSRTSGTSPRAAADPLHLLLGARCAPGCASTAARHLESVSPT